MTSQFSIPKTDSIPLVILYRSLYIVKQKFQKYKSQITEIYNKYSLESIKNEIVNPSQSQILQIKINISSFTSLVNELLPLISIIIVPIKNPNELFIYDYISPIKQKEFNEKITDKLNAFLLENLHKYNELYYNKKIYPIKIINQYNVSDREGYPIVEYDKKGKITKTFEQVKKESDYFYYSLYPIQETKQTFDSLEEITKFNNILYIETLPVIIADFIQKYNNNAVIDLENEEISNEVRSLFDKEILVKLSKENKLIKKEIGGSSIKEQNEINELLKEQLNVVKNIKLYESIQKEKNKKGENVSYITEIIEKLTHEKENIGLKIKKRRLNSVQYNLKESNSDYTNFNKMIESQTEGNIKPKIIPKKKSSNHLSHLFISSKETKIENSLKDIFHFYTNQHHFSGNSPLFDDIQNKRNHLDLAEFAKFCVEFQVNVPKSKTVELFKKNTSNQKEMTYNEFIFTLHQMGTAMNNTKIQNLSKKIERLKEKLSLMKTETNEGLQEFRRRSVYNSPSKKSTHNSPIKGTNNLLTNDDNFNSHRVSHQRASILFESKKRNLLNEVNNLEDTLERLKSLTVDEQFDEFIEFLGIDKNNSYKQKMKGFIIPFHNMKERYLFFEGEEQFFKVKNKIALSKIQKINYEKLKEQKIKKEIEKEKKFQKKVKNFEKNIKILEEHYSDKLRDKKYCQIKEKKDIYDKENRGEYNYNWNRIENVGLDALELDEKEKEIFIESDNSDDIELLKHLNNEKSEIIQPEKEKEAKPIILPETENKKEKEKEKVVITNENKEISQIMPPSQSNLNLLQNSKDNILITQQKRKENTIRKKDINIKLDNPLPKPIDDKDKLPPITTITEIDQRKQAEINNDYQKLYKNLSQQTQPKKAWSNPPQLNLPFIINNNIQPNQNIIQQSIPTGNSKYDYINTNLDTFSPQIQSLPNYQLPSQSDGNINQSNPSSIRHHNPYFSKPLSGFSKTKLLATRNSLQESLHKKQELYESKVSENLSLIEKIRESREVKIISKLEHPHQKVNIYPFFNKNHTNQTRTNIV